MCSSVQLDGGDVVVVGGGGDGECRQHLRIREIVVDCGEVDEEEEEEEAHTSHIRRWPHHNVHHNLEDQSAFQNHTLLAGAGAGGSDDAGGHDGETR